VAQRYGRPARGWHAVQIEIDRSLYMNERMIRPNGNFDNVRRIVTSVIARAIEARRARCRWPPSKRSG
jgi:N-formylglutamate amidohydrolase